MKYEIQRREVGLMRYRVLRDGNPDADLPWNRERRVIGYFWTKRSAHRWIAKRRWTTTEGTL